MKHLKSSNKSNKIKSITANRITNRKRNLNYKYK